MIDIKNLINQKENRKLEFKQELPSNDKIIKTAIAFSNSQGGDLIIGIGDDNTLIGIDENELISYEEIISNTIYDNCIPNIMPNIYSIRIENKTLLIVHFYPSSSKPHYIKSLGKTNSTYVRVGSSNRLATQDVLESLEREKRNISFDSVINFEERYEEAVFDNIIEKIEDKLNLEPNASNFEKLKFIKKEHDIYYLTNLGTWFCKNREDYFPLIKCECARFKGKTTKVFLDQATYDKNIIDSIEQAIELIRKDSSNVDKKIIVAPDSSDTGSIDKLIQEVEQKDNYSLDIVVSSADFSKIKKTVSNSNPKIKVRKLNFKYFNPKKEQVAIINK